MVKQGKAEERRSIAKNRKARHEYHILEEMECGIVLVGTEVKSLRGGQCSLQEAFVRVQGEQLWLMRAHIPEYTYGHGQNHSPVRERKLLAHRHQINKWAKLAKEKGTTMVPLEVYFQGSRVKVQVALCKGKKLHDKRAAVRERDDRRDTDRELSRRR